MAEEQQNQSSGQADNPAQQPAQPPTQAPAEAKPEAKKEAPPAQEKTAEEKPAQQEKAAEAKPEESKGPEAAKAEEKKAPKPKKPKAPTTAPEFPYNDEIKNDIKKNRFFGAIAYFPLIGWIVVLALRAGSRYASFHARQGLIFCLLQMLAGASVIMGSAGFLILGLFLGFGLVGFLEGAAGHYWNLPLIGAIAQKLTFL